MDRAALRSAEAGVFLELGPRPVLCGLGQRCLEGEAEVTWAASMRGPGRRQWDGLLSAVEAEATADIQAMVGASRDERALSPVRFAVAKRLPWLQINLLTAFLASFVVGVFEDTIARLTALAVLLPVVAGQISAATASVALTPGADPP